MKKTLFVGSCLSIAWLLAADIADATHLGSFTNDVYWYTMSDTYPDTERGMLYQLGLTDDDMLNRIDRPDGAEYMFSEPAFIPYARRVTFEDIGRTFAVNNTNYDYWNEMVDHLLIDESSLYVCKNQGAIDVSSFPFEWTFTGAYEGQGIDFQNYTIDNLLITIDDLQVRVFDSTSEYYWSLASTITVDGIPSVPVPEPSILLLLGTSLAGLAGSRLKRKKK